MNVAGAGDAFSSRIFRKLSSGCLVPKMIVREERRVELYANS